MLEFKQCNNHIIVAYVTLNSIFYSQIRTCGINKYFQIPSAI